MSAALEHGGGMDGVCVLFYVFCCMCCMCFVVCGMSICFVVHVVIQCVCVCFAVSQWRAPEADSQRHGEQEDDVTVLPRQGETDCADPRPHAEPGSQFTVYAINAQCLLHWGWTQACLHDANFKWKIFLAEEKKAECHWHLLTISWSITFEQL